MLRGYAIRNNKTLAFIRENGEPFNIRLWNTKEAAKNILNDSLYNPNVYIVGAMYDDGFGDRDYYIKKISALSDRYGDKLLELMDAYCVSSLGEITEEQIEEFYERLTHK